MTDGVSTVVSGLVGLAGTGGAAAIVAAAVHRQRPYLAAGHAIGAPDATGLLPLALRLRLGGLTVPVRPGPRGELFVGHGEPEPGRTLRRLVLRPLANALAARGGRLHPEQRAPFGLVVEFVGPERDATTLLRAYRALDRQLRDHGPMLSRFSDGRFLAGAVTVTVDGTLNVRRLTAAQDERYAFAEGTFDDIGSASAPASVVPAVSDRWFRRFGWDGQEPFPAEERHLLHGLVAAAHAEGRTVRIGGVPARPGRIRRAFWSELRAAGVDAITDPDAVALARFLRSRPVRRSSAAPATLLAGPATRPA
jgi:hypothetical protein